MSEVIEILHRSIRKLDRGAQVRMAHRQAVRAVKYEFLVLGLSECSELSIQDLSGLRAHPTKFCFTIPQLELTAGT
ncbi:hypothetical protein AAFX91_00345 [Bradyrhizobium sp. 31Argb]|uniref:hypothetical protein n=1 Tax=unclassified Bradyrhizobium TaxID=2631580 RepID=UPI00102E7441|nr:hypothetical protein [Bradyrhizobium sp. Leo170]